MLLVPKFPCSGRYIQNSLLLTDAIRRNDREAVERARNIVADKFGDEFADHAVTLITNHLMETEGWSFFDDDGNASELV